MEVVPPSAPELVESVPPETVVAPLKVFAPERVQVLLPVLVNDVPPDPLSPIIPESSPACVPVDDVSVRVRLVLVPERAAPPEIVNLPEEPATSIVAPEVPSV